MLSCLVLFMHTPLLSVVPLVMGHDPLSCKVCVLEMKECVTRKKQKPV